MAVNDPVFMGRVTGPLTSTVGNVAVWADTHGSVLADGSGGGAFVSSITGTANQITASAATGAVTLSIPSTFIAPGSIAATTTVGGTTGNFGTSVVVGSSTLSFASSALNVNTAIIATVGNITAQASGARVITDTDFSLGPSILRIVKGASAGLFSFNNGNLDSGVGVDIAAADGTFWIKSRAFADTATVKANVFNATGSEAVVGANAQAVTLQQATTALTTNSGGVTATATNLIPAGSIVMGVTARVTTILAGAALTTFQLGDGTTTNQWGGTVAIAAGTTVSSQTGDYVATWKPTYYGAATSVILTANAGIFSSGVIRLTVHYFNTTAPTS